MTCRYVRVLVPTRFVRIQVHGSSVGGDAGELGLLSTSDSFINLCAHGGSLNFLSTKVPTARVITRWLGRSHTPLSFRSLSPFQQFTVT